MKKLFLLVLFCFAVYGFINSPLFLPMKSFKLFFTATKSSSDQALEKIFHNKQSDIQVGGSGKIVKILPDDTQGSQHQKFIIKLESGQTLLIAHNIDIAPKINSIKIGDHINFYGEYEWNSQGGVVHWTHHDPRGRHKDGWLNHGGKMYK